MLQVRIRFNDEGCQYRRVKTSLWGWLRHILWSAGEHSTNEDEESVDILSAVFDLVDVRLSDGLVQRRPSWRRWVRNLHDETLSFVIPDIA